MTRRYLVGLGLVATILTLQVATMNRQIDGARQDAETINRSGMQRMLTQRIAMLVRDLADDEGRAPRNRANTEALLEHAVNTMRRNAAFLTEGESAPAAGSRALREQYGGPDGLDASVSAYADDTERLIATSREGGTEAVLGDPTYERILATEESLLGELDDAVHQHSAEAAGRVDRFFRWELTFFLLGLVLLLLEGLLLFNPLVKRLDQTFRALEDAMAEREAFSRRLSHDLRAPLATARGFNEVLGEAIDERDLEEAAFAAERTDAALGRLEDLLSDLSSLTRTRLSHTQDAEPVDLERCVLDAVHKAQHLLDEAGVEITRNVTVDVPVLTHRVVLQVVLDNLISNAAKYSDPHREASFVRIGVNQEGRDCVVRVEDNGLGIPEQHRDDLFGAFRRFHPKASFGSGLGLYLTQEAARALGGSIRYTPTKHGSSFELRFPYLPADERSPREMRAA